MHSYAFQRSYKRQAMTDIKSHNASQIRFFLLLFTYFLRFSLNVAFLSLVTKLSQGEVYDVTVQISHKNFLHSNVQLFVSQKELSNLLKN